MTKTPGPDLRTSTGTAGPARPPSVDTLPVSAIVITKDEAASIVACVDALADFDEIIVVDSASADGTAEAARARGARLVEFRWNGKYPKKKQWALDHAGAAHDWVLLLDADETPTREFVDELRGRLSELAGDELSAYDVPLEYVFGGRSLRHGHRVVKRMLLRRSAVRFDELGDLGAPGIREVEGHYQPRVLRGRLGRFDARVRHDDRDPVTTWFARHNRYSDWEAHLRAEPGLHRRTRGNRSRQGRLFDRVPCKPLAFFLYSYVARAGFRDGRQGFDYAVALSFYYWQISVKSGELRRRAASRGGAAPREAS